ncbi:phosphotransferase enzyme family protein [Nocardia sp. NPDC051570]|uniref:phosphotransferase enzyme family protein n=1 Tax=Nocardia sp. NPDC051570 TaxID=3364324 RepID=UPI00378E9776
MTAAKTSDEVLADAAQVADIDLNGRRIIREGSHAIYQVAGGIVARIGKRGSREAAEREVRISQWLNSVGIRAVEPVESLPQPVVVDDRPVTWWRLIPDHRPATPAELGSMLHALHTLTPPNEPKLPEYDPFDTLRERLVASDVADEGDRMWLQSHYDDLRRRFDELPKPQALHVIHGDAWQGNLVVPASGTPILLDLDKVSLGWPEWDLIQLAVDYTDFSRVSEADYRSFVEAYGGFDLTTQPSFRVLADIQELRWVGFALGQATASAAVAQQAKHRIACLRGKVPRPWRWEAL